MYVCMYVCMYEWMKYCSALLKLFFSCYIGVIGQNQGIRHFVLNQSWYKSDLQTLIFTIFVYNIYTVLFIKRHKENDKSFVGFQTTDG